MTTAERMRLRAVIATLRQAHFLACARPLDASNLVLGAARDVERMVTGELRAKPPRKVRHPGAAPPVRVGRRMA